MGGRDEQVENFSNFAVIGCVGVPGYDVSLWLGGVLQVKIGSGLCYTYSGGYIMVLLKAAKMYFPLAFNFFNAGNIQGSEAREPSIIILESR